MTTPKEKAEELHNKFFEASRLTMQGASSIFKQTAKDCALICVEEILKIHLWASSYENIPDRIYWKEVKKEIESL